MYAVSLRSTSPPWSRVSDNPLVRLNESLTRIGWPVARSEDVPLSLSFEVEHGESSCLVLLHWNPDDQEVHLRIWRHTDPSATTPRLSAVTAIDGRAGAPDRSSGSFGIDSGGLVWAACLNDHADLLASVRHGVQSVLLWGSTLQESAIQRTQNHLDLSDHHTTDPWSHAHTASH